MHRSSLFVVTFKGDRYNSALGQPFDFTLPVPPHCHDQVLQYPELIIVCRLCCTVVLNSVSSRNGFCGGVLSGIGPCSQQAAATQCRCSCQHPGSAWPVQGPGQHRRHARRQALQCGIRGRATNGPLTSDLIVGRPGACAGQAPGRCTRVHPSSGAVVWHPAPAK